MPDSVATSDSSRSRALQTRIALWAGFGGLLLLMVALGLSAFSFLYQIERREDKIRNDYVARDRTLERLRANIFLSGTYIRDFLLDTDEILAANHRSQFVDARRRVQEGLAAYRHLLRPQEVDAFHRLQAQLDSYFSVLSPALQWTHAERQNRGREFIDAQVLPRRMTAVNLADEIQEISEKQLERSSQEVADLFSSFRAKLLLLLGLTFAVGLCLAGMSLLRILRLEGESAARFEQALKTREELKQLSAELVTAQENERRRISRELHDEVGQVLSAMMLGLGNLQNSVTTNNGEEALRQVDALRQMTERNAQVVRNLSLLLRPTMLDDLGLVAALKWLAREVSRSSTLQVDVSADERPEVLPEEYRTCIFRVVQEAVRNACRHAGARQTRIYVQMEDDAVRVSVQDDGQGFDPARDKGMGILGMQERVARLGGSLKIDSEPGRGTILSFQLPLPKAGIHGDRVGQAPLSEWDTIAQNKKVLQT